MHYIKKNLFLTIIFLLICNSCYRQVGYIQIEEENEAVLEDLEIETSAEKTSAQKELEDTLEWKHHLLSTNQKLQLQLEKQTEYIKSLSDVEKIYSDNEKLESQILNYKWKIKDLEKENAILTSTFDDKVKKIKIQIEEKAKLEIKKNRDAMNTKYTSIESMTNWMITFCMVWSVVQAMVNKWIRADLIDIALMVRGLILNSFSLIIKLGYAVGNIITVAELNCRIVLQGAVHMMVWFTLSILVYGLPLIGIYKVLSRAVDIINADADGKTIAIANVVMIGLAALVLIMVILLIIFIVQMCKLKKRYKIFMQGNNAKSLEDTLIYRLEQIDELIEANASNERNIDAIFKNMKDCFQKIGLVKYDAFNEMGGKLSFSLCLLNEKNTGFIINAMHSREGCYTYVKEVIDGNSVIQLAEEEEQALEEALGSI